MLGMYVHTHWGYNHPYAARTWTLEDWRGYLEGLAALGYDFLMIWPLLDSMPPEPTPSDQDFLKRVGRVIDLAHDGFGMRVVIVAAANTIGNERASAYAFAERPYFLCEAKVNPRDPAAVEAFLRGRKAQLAPLGRADGCAIIDSDPGGYIGSTNAEFVALAARQIELLRCLNPRAELIYWMWFGWECINRFQARAAAGQPADMASEENEADFTETLRLLRQGNVEPWSLYLCRPVHEQPVAALGLNDKALFFPYGLIEGEPTFPLTNWDPAAVAGRLQPAILRQCPRGAMANAQTHCLQLPHTYLFAHLARGGSVASADLRGMAEDLIPGAGAAIAAAWEATGATDAALLRDRAKALQAAQRRAGRKGPLAGLLFGDASRFLADLAMNLEVRAALLDFRGAVVAGQNSAPAVRRALAAIRPYQQRTGFADAYYGPLAEGFNAPLRRLHVPEVDAVLSQFENWRDASARNGVLLRLLDAAEHYCRREGV